MQILTMMMMIMMMSFLYSSLADQSLECYNDYYNTITCVWNTSALSVRPETGCEIHVVVTKSLNKWAVNSSVPLISEEAVKGQRRCWLTRPGHTSALPPWIFNLKGGVIIQSAKLREEVRCENYSGPLAKIAEHEARHSVKKAAPPQEVEVRGLNASWTVSFKHKREFEVQFRSAAQSWTDVKGRPALETSLTLSEDELVSQQQYVIRVRVKLKLPNAIWSDWSQEYSWTSEVGLTPTAQDVSEILTLDWLVAGFTLIGLALVVVSVCAFLNRRKSLQKKCSLDIPDPSKFFGDLNSQHGGNFTSWLGPLLSHESFIKVDTECVSPVEVLKQPDAGDSRSSHRDSDGLQDRWEGTSKSNFSNSTYFLSQSSKGPIDTLEPCSMHSSYGPAGGVSGPDPVHARITRDSQEKELELSVKTLEKLRQDTQSPDSGFAGGGEDSMEESDLPSPLALNLTRLLPRDLPAPHPIMHPLLGFEHTGGLSCMFPGLLDLDLQSPCGMIEPSSGGYMPVKNVQN